MKNHIFFYLILAIFFSCERAKIANEQQQVSPKNKSAKASNGIPSVTFEENVTFEQATQVLNSTKYRKDYYEITRGNRTESWQILDKEARKFLNSSFENEIQKKMLAVMMCNYILAKKVIPANSDDQKVEAVGFYVKKMQEYDNYSVILLAETLTDSKKYFANDETTLKNIVKTAITKTTIFEEKDFPEIGKTPNQKLDKIANDSKAKSIDEQQEKVEAIKILNNYLNN